MINQERLLKVGYIMMEWAVVNGDYETAYKLFTEFGIGISSHLLYKLPTKKYLTLDTLGESETVVGIGDEFLRELLVTVKRGKWCKLPTGKYGYILLTER